MSMPLKDILDKELGKIAQTDPKQASQHLDKGKELLGKGDFGRARLHFSASENLNPSFQKEAKRGTALSRNKELAEQVLREYRSSLLGGNFAKALTAAERAFSLDSFNLDARDALQTAAVLNERWDVFKRTDYFTNHRSDYLHIRKANDWRPPSPPYKIPNLDGYSVSWEEAEHYIKERENEITFLRGRKILDLLWKQKPSRFYEYSSLKIEAVKSFEHGWQCEWDPVSEIWFIEKRKNEDGEIIQDVIRPYKWKRILYSIGGYTEEKSLGFIFDPKYEPCTFYSEKPGGLRKFEENPHFSTGYVHPVAVSLWELETRISGDVPFQRCIVFLKPGLLNSLFQETQSVCYHAVLTVESPPGKLVVTPRGDIVEVSIPLNFRPRFFEYSSGVDIKNLTFQ